MYSNKFRKYIVVALLLIAAVSFVWWLLYNPVKNFTPSYPGADKRPPRGSDTNEIVKIGEKFKFFAEETSALTGKWTNFRGSDLDNICKDKTPLIDHFAPKGPVIVWKEIMGEGHAAPAIYNGKVYVLDYYEAKKSDALRCFSLESGKELWRRYYSVHVKRNHGMSRTVPAVTEKYVVTMGPKCHVMCCNPANGDFLWGIDLQREYKTEVPFWHTGQCPLIDNDVAIIAPGGTSLIIAVDCATGKVLWKTPNPDGWKMSHSSIMPMTLNGKKMYVYAAIGGICGISAQGADAGQLLWKTIDFAPSVVAPSPLVLDNGKIFITAGYGAGAMLFQVLGSGNSFSVKVLQNFKPKDGICSEQQTPIYYNGHIFIILPKDAGGMRTEFVCCTPADCKKILWTSGKEARFGLGPYILADGKFFILNDEGILTIAQASTEKFMLLDRAKIIDGQDSWGPIAIADGRLIMRDSKQMVCIDIRKK